MAWAHGERLSPNFTLDEFERGDLGGEVPDWGVDRLRDLCCFVLQPIRNRFGRVRVTSGYRPGSDGSQHQKCEAADIHMVDAMRPVVFRWLRDESGLDFDQAIIYSDTHHLHLSYTSRRPNRREIRVHVTGDEVSEYGTEYPLWRDYHGPMRKYWE